MGIFCGVCGRDAGVRREEDLLGLYRCGLCGHVFKRIDKEKEEKYGEGYFAEEHKNWFANPDYPLFEYILAQTKTLTGKAAPRILDIGCGKGDFLKFARSKNPALELYGIDLVDNRYPGINFIREDFMAADLKEKFDIITNIAVIEHVNDPKLFLRKAVASLADGGIIFTVTDNDDSMIYAAARLLKKTGLTAPYERLYSTHHLQCFSKRSLAMLTEDSGLDIITQVDHNHPVEAVDYPRSDPATAFFYKAAVRSIFFISGMLGRGIMQIAVCKKRMRPA